MRTYFERHMTCRKCNESQRQTVYNLPLNRVGLKMESAAERDFMLAHKCKAGVTYTEWRLISDRDYR